MKVKLTLQRPAGQVDLAATVDSATTVGELARYLVTADPQRPAPAETNDEFTLGLSHPNVALDPRQPVADSGLRSGATVTISRAGRTFADPHRTPAAVLHVIDGPDAGQSFELLRGSSILGRQRGCEVRLTDTLVSRRHVRINVSDVVEIVDLGSANGVQIDDLPVPRSIVRATDVVQVGDTRFSVRMVQGVPGNAGGDTAHVRSPRLDPVYEGQTFEAPELPERLARQRFPLIALVAPILMGGVLYLITRSAVSVAFVALSPLMLIGGAVESRIAGRSAYRKAVNDFRSDVESLIAEAQAAAQNEIALRDGEHPSSAACLASVKAATPLLWTRRPGERAFAEVRLGLGRMPSRSRITLPTARKAARALFAELTDKTAPLAFVEPVPVVGALAESAIGVGGPRELAVPVARSLLAQLAILHSPAELLIAAAVSSRSAQDWDWLKWLPHTSAPTSPLSVRALTSSSTACALLVSELEDLLAQRIAGSEGGAHVPAIVMLVDQDAPADHSRLVQLAERGPRYGVHVVWVAAEVAGLPAACRTYVEIGRDATAGRVGFVHTGVEVTAVQCDAVTAAEATELARKLCPIVDLGARGADSSDLPRAVSLLAINGPELASAPQAVIERWAENRSLITGPLAPPTPPKHVGSLRAVIGEAAGQKLALDLRTDGPHALVGGTTGSGKSELLQAWILALAAAHSPQRLTFLLIDYKGGSAFRDCVELPHTVGLVTDLSPHLVRRALTSLKAELRYREHLLAKHAAKDLATLEKQGVADAPPSLVIVVDEFAALVTEVPEFVDGVVNVAQRGRSLGLHLILATQRPAGVIKDNLRANTNLRLALRMADEADSTDVLDSPEAAFFDPALPGRAVAKTGPGRLIPFQTGYAGGWTTDEPPPPNILVEELTFGAATAWEPPEETEAVSTDLGPTDIRRLVDSIGRASEIAQLAPPRKPWLPELRAVYDLADRAAVPNRRVDTELVFGVGDDPDNQQQLAVAFHPDHDGNLAVYGTGGSGKSTLLRTLAISAGFTVHGGPCHVYGIDFGARGLAMLERLPHVGSIIGGSDHERITRLLTWLRGLIDERALRYSRANAGTITDYRRLSGEAAEPRILLLVDGIAAFRQSYETSDRLRWFDLFTGLAADGRPVGVHIVLSSEVRSGMTTTLASAVQARVVLRLASEEDYTLLGVAPDVLTSGSPAGRGLFGAREVQVAMLGGSADVVRQATAVEAFADSMRRSGAAEAAPIGRLPEKVLVSQLPRTASGLPVLGLAGGTLDSFTIEPRGTFIISGPPGSGRTTTLLSLAQALSAWNPKIRMHYYGSRRSPLATLDCWAFCAYGAADVAQAAMLLTTEIASGSPSDPMTAVFVEGVGEFVGGLADTPLQDLAKTCVTQDQFFVAEGETSSLTSTFGLLGAVKASRAGIALAPDQGDGTTVYRTNFPRTNRADFPPGRGLLVELGRTEVVQIGYPVIEHL